MHATEATRGGYAQVVVAGGTESMSQAPYLLPQARWGLRMGHGEVYDTMLGEGLTCAIEALPHGHDRRRGVAAVRHRRARSRTRSPPRARRAPRAAIAAGAFRDEIVPVPLPARKGGPASFETDEHPRPGTSAATLGGLKPAFTPEGTVTAGNASGINDGAAALVVASPAAAAARGLRADRARPVVRRGRASSRCVMGLGPIGAVRLALERAGLAASDIASVRAQRGVCRAGPGRRRASWASTARR